MPQFADQADFEIRFQPFQLYPNLPMGDNDGVDKKEFFTRLQTMRNGGVPLDEDPEAKKAADERRAMVDKIWRADGVNVAPREGRWGQSFDAQRIISLSRKQGKEDGMVEEIYKGNHEQNQPLSEWKFLMAAAERAGVTGVTEEWLASDAEKAEVIAKIKKHIGMGIDAVPVICVNDLPPHHGAPEYEWLAKTFEEEIAKAKGKGAL